MSNYDSLWQSLQAAVGAFIAHVALYLVFASVAWLIFYVLFYRLLKDRKISPNWPKLSQTKWEYIYSVRSTMIFGLVTGGMYYAAITGWSQVYWNIADYGWAWFITSVILSIFIHDAYFYWTHRLMHVKQLYRPFHRVHHLSISPTPWATYSFSVLEAFIQAGIGPLLIVVMPLHPAAFASFIVWQVFFNVLGHCGYETFPRWFMQSKLSKFINSSTHHAQHHERFRANFGLYFNIWDRLMGTNHHEYEQRFEQVTAEKVAV